MALGYAIPATDGIARWITEQVADYVGVAPTQLHPSMPLAEYGLDSVSAVGLCGDIERRFQIVVDPTMVFDYPTIDRIAGFIAAEATPARASW